MTQQLAVIKQQQVLTAAHVSRARGEADDTSGINVEEGKDLGAGGGGDLHSSNISGLSNSLGFVPVNPPFHVSPHTMSSPSPVPPGGVFFENNRGHCYVCGIELTSLQHKMQHVEGKQHKKRSLAFGSGDRESSSSGNFGGEGVMMCSICQVPLSGELNVQQHFNSQKHKTRKMEYDRQKSTSGANSSFLPPDQRVATALPQPPSSASASSSQFFSLHGPGSLPGTRVSFPGQATPQFHAGATRQPVQGAGPVDNGSCTSPESLKFEWLPSKNRGACQMCDQHFQSLQEGLQHLGSAEHKQREEELMKPSCDVCHVQYSGYASAQQHLNSEKHKKCVLLKQSTTSNSSALTDSALSLKMSHTSDLDAAARLLTLSDSFHQTNPKYIHTAASQSTGFPLPPPAQTQPEARTLNPLNVESRPAVPVTQYNIAPSVVENYKQEAEAPPSIQEYIFDGSRGMCNVCKVEFTSKSHAESHLAGAKHQKAALRWRQAAGAPQASARPADFTVPAQGLAQPQPNLGPRTEAGLPAVDSETGQQAFRFDGQRGYCFACKVELTSSAHANQHLVGKKHQTATERWIVEGQLCSYPLYCDVCYKPFTGQESAAQHFASEKHKKKVLLAEAVEVSSESKRDPVTGALLILRDGQMWYMCEVCKCPLNTPEQFRLHVNSPRHNAEVEKSKKQDHSNRSSPADAGEAAARCSPDPSDLQYLVTKSSVKTTPGISVPLPQPTPWVTSVLGNREPRDSVSTSTHAMPGLHNTRPNSGTSSAFTAVTRPSDLNFPHRQSAGSEHQDYIGVERNAFPENTHRGLAHNNPVSNSHSSFQVDGSTSFNSSQSHSQGHAFTTHRTPGTRSSALAQGSDLNIRPIPHGAGGSRGSRSAGQVLRKDGDYEMDDDDMKTLPVSASSASYQDSEREHQQGDASMTVSSVHGGDRLSLTEQEKRQLGSEVNSMSDRLTSINTDRGSLTAKPILQPETGGIAAQPQTAEPNPFKGFRYSCLLCKQPMNTKEDYERHMKGLKHQMKAATVSAPDRSRESLVKKCDVTYDDAYHCSKTTPRLYQVELMQKSMASDSTVVYLPTGTGKTLAAMMTLSRMLTLNPTRPVLFLVDKVLLVLQQARYIINELGNREFNRPDLLVDKEMKMRTLKVAVLCGGLSVRDGTPLWKHDVIVTTAAFCQNLLQEEVLRWANFSLVVFDEAHHCTKNHPYNKLLSEHHLSLPASHRPKVLGLTASPAGRRTKEETLNMLKDLLKNLGGASLAIIEEPKAKQQLDTYSSSARLVPVCVPMTEAEMGFHEKLLSYFIRAYVELMSCSNLQQISCKDLQDLLKSKPQPPNGEDIKRFAQHLMSEPDELSEMVQLAQTARMKSSTVTQSKFENIRMHVMTVGMTLLNSEDGIDFVLDDLERLFDRHFNRCFDELKEMGLPCEEIGMYVNTLCDAAKLRTSEEGERSGAGVEGGAPSSMSIFQELLGTLSNREYMTWEGKEAMALVLVRERKVAHKFKDHLKRTSFVRQNNKRVAVVVGHGAGSGEGEGMNLRKQDKVLQGIKSHRYDIVVATSVAEEGVDIPECQLVVCLNPPTTVKALVQMRGRARKKDSYFVVLCSSQREKEKLVDLQKQELNMKWAAAQLTQQHQSDD